MRVTELNSSISQFLGYCWVSVIVLALPAVSRAAASAVYLPHPVLKAAAGTLMAIEAYQLGEDLSTWATTKTTKAAGVLRTIAWASNNATADVKQTIVSTEVYGFDLCQCHQKGVNEYEAKARAEAWFLEGVFWDSTELRFPEAYNWANGEDLGKAFFKSVGEFGITGTKRPNFPWLKIIKRLGSIIIDPPTESDIIVTLDLGAKYSDGQGNNIRLWDAHIELAWDTMVNDYIFTVTDSEGLLTVTDFEKTTYIDPLVGEMVSW